MNCLSLLPKSILPLINSSFNSLYMQCSAKLWSAVIKASAVCPRSWHLLANLAFSCITFCLSVTSTSKVSFCFFFSIFFSFSSMRHRQATASGIARANTKASMWYSYMFPNELLKFSAPAVPKLPKSIFFNRVICCSGSTAYIYTILWSTSKKESLCLKMVKSRSFWSRFVISVLYITKINNHPINRCAHTTWDALHSVFIYITQTK